MQTEVYVDILLCVNMIINYLLLLATSKLIQLNTVKLKLLLSAFVGSLFSFTIFLPEQNFILSLLIKLLCSAAMVLIGFKASTVKVAVKNILLFFSVNVVFVGVMIVLFLSVFSSSLIINNSVIYLDISPLILIISTSIAYIFVHIANKFFKRRTPTNYIYTITPELNGNSLVLSAFLDTGNQLSDIFSSTPVVICSYESIKPLLPAEVVSGFNSNKSVTSILESIKNESYFNKFRLIPYKAVGISSFILAFKCDKFAFKTASSELQFAQAFIGISLEPLFFGQYDALINSDVISQARASQTAFAKLG